MAIFNSLGSNYNFSFAWKALFAQGSPEHSENLKSFLEKKYQGKAVLLYKAREAILLALRSLNLPRGSAVAINGYTCYAVYKAIVDAGLQVEYLDVAPGNLNFSAAELKTSLQRNSNIKAVIIQNTLGYVCDMENIAQLCRQNNIILIEDLAHSVGAVYANGQQAGTVGDFTVLSFSQDKMIDAISGGALVIRNPKYYANNIEKQAISGKRQFIDRIYPQATWKIRIGYPVGLGKLTHLVYQKLNLLPKPMGDLDRIVLHELPNWYCGLVYFQFKNLGKNLQHRRQLAEVYAQNLENSILLPSISSQISGSANLRLPVLVKNRKKLIDYLKSRGIHISDIWYDAPVAPAKYLPMTNYKNQCPEAQKISAEMVNLPTHVNVKTKDAKFIAATINQWLKLQ